jgi:hypothetical protein
MKELKVGDKIVLNVSKLRHKLPYIQNINGLIIDIWNGVGIEKKWYSREELQLVSHNGFKDYNIHKDEFSPIREACS